MKTFCQSFLLVAAFSLFAAAQIKLEPHKITLKTGDSFEVNLPAAYTIAPAVEGLHRVRFFAKAPDGRIFVTDMHDLSDNRLGAIYILDEFDLQTGKFRKVTTYLTNLRNPNSVGFLADANGQDWLYLALTDKLVRYKFTKGETAPTDNNPQTLATFPDYGLSYKYGGWHLTRTIAVAPDGKKIYVSVGSSCNACKEKEEVRASVLEMNPDGSDQRFFARGLRNAVGLKFFGGALYATNQGVDHLGLDKPDETFYELKNNTDYGWASCYQAAGGVFTDPKNAGRVNCRNVPKSFAYFPAHSSALGFDRFGENAPDENLKNSFLVALHGSTNKRIGHGYKLVIVHPNGKTEDFLTGFLQRGVVYGRPCDVYKLDENAFLLTDDNRGVIYYVKRKS